MSTGLSSCCVQPQLKAATVLPPTPFAIQKTSQGFAPNQADVGFDFAGAKPPALEKTSVVSFLLSLDDSNLSAIVEHMHRERPVLSAWQIPNASFKKDNCISLEAAKVLGEDKGVQFPDLTRRMSQFHEVIDTKDPKHHAYEHPVLKDLELLKRPSLPTVQFSAPMFFANEEAGFAEVEVMLVGNLAHVNGGNAVIQWATADGSAKAGIKYRAAQGKVEFGPSSTFEKIRVELINNDDWDPTLDFCVVLKEEGAKNAEVHRYHMKCRVKIIDDDAFPSNRWQDALLNNRVEDVPPIQLVIDFIKLNLKNKVVKKGVFKAIASDFLENLQFFLLLILKVYLINSLLMPALDGDDSGSGERPMLLTVVALCFLLPYFFLHYLSYRRNAWKLGGAPRKLLQANLMRKFMSYTSSVRNGVDHGELILVLFKEIPGVVTHVFGSLFPLVKDITLLIMLFLYQTVGTTLLGSETAEPQWILLNTGILVLFPVFQAIALKCRHRKLHESMEASKKAERACTECTIDMLNNYNLLADYLNRGQAVGAFEKKVDAFNKAVTEHNTLTTNDKFIPKALSYTICACWILFGGLLIVRSDGHNTPITLGTYLAQWEIIDQIGSSWQDIYEHLLTIQDCLTELQNIVRFMNYPVENRTEKEFMNVCAEKGQEIARSLPKDDGDAIMVDMLPIKLAGFSHKFEGRTIFNNVMMDMEQGMLHCLAGRRDSGKTTLLKIIGGRSLMATFDGQGYFFIPQHLRVLHISKDPLFFDGTLLANLTYGVPEGDKDGDLARVVDICKGINILPETLGLISKPPDKTKKTRVAHWNEELSRSDRQLLNIVRGLVANPEVLCVHKPSMGLGPNTVPIVLGVLKNFVEHRGIAQDMDRYFFRRPRTCIYSLSTEQDMLYADVVHHPFSS